MRQYIRHPSDIPIDFQVTETAQMHTNHLIDVSVGGLCFMADRPFASGTKIHISIPTGYAIGEPCSNDSYSEDFAGDGTVAWCHQDGIGYSIGVQFEDSMTQFGIRMVEQVCHIEHYRYDVLQEEGRRLSSEEAAKEWIERFAAEFPSVS